LDEKFGYTVEAVVGKTLAYLDEYRETLSRLAALAR
jgi:hypothetical protein